MARSSYLLFFFLLLLTACGSEPSSEVGTSTPIAQMEPGKELMEQYCGICHLSPSPTELDQTTWRDHILVRMAAYMGIYYAYEGSYDQLVYYDSIPERWIEPGEGGKRARENQIYPDQPLLSRAEFEQIRDYILANAPSSTTGPAGTFQVPPDLAGFRPRLIRLPAEYEPLVTAVHIDPAESAFYVGLYEQALLKLDAKGQVLDEIKGLTMPVDIQSTPSGFSVVDMGSFGGSDDPRGSVQMASNWGRFKRKQFQSEQGRLMRPVQQHVADLDGDGDPDRLLLEFGYHLGRMTWWENTGSDEVEHILFDDDGAVAAQIYDWNGDGRLDIAALLANSDEQLVVYGNEGKGKFSRHLIERYPPSWGGAYLEMADMNGDGKMDLITAHGDNGDYPPILKPGHGIRIYHHQNEFDFEPGPKLPMNGAYGIRAHDFDADGDVDLAAVSFYPDYQNRPEEQFIYFEHTSPGTFSPHTFHSVNVSRWMVMDAGDLDQDGDVDLVLGGFNTQSDDATAKQYDFWMQRSIGLVVLENTLK